LSVVRHQQIGPTALAFIEHGDAERFLTAVENAAGGSDVFEGAVAAIVK
jgi:hypothetical protein